MRCTLPTALLAVALAVGHAQAQRGGSKNTSTNATAVARFVPVSARVFVSVNNMREVDAAMKTAHAWQLLAIASGGAPSDAPTFDVRAALGALLGGQSRISTTTLMSTQVALAARSWSELEGAVWYIRLPDEHTLDRWFPPGNRRDSRISPDARLIKMPSGVIACVRDGIVALGRRFEPDSLLRETVRLMASRRATSLLQSEPYRNLSTYLPGRPLATAYLVANPDLASTAAEHSRSLWDIFPDMKYVVVGMFEREGRIDLAVRGRRATPSASTALETHVLERLRKLPHTTVLASAVTVRVDEFLSSVRSDVVASDRLARYVRVLLSLRERAVGADVPLPALGPSVILAWDEDFRAESSTPQLALLVESSDARALASEVGVIAQNLIELAHTLDPVDPEHAPAVSLDVHLGTPIAHADLEAYAKRSSFPIAKFLSNVEFSWAAHSGWLIITLSKDHLERIIEAGVGLAPTLATVRDARSVWQLGGKRSAVAFLQADAAAGVLGEWLSEVAAGKPSLLTHASFPARGTEAALAPLGVEFDASSPAGVVTVGSIRDGSPASGQLRVGDRIVGLDGELLDIALPDRDLERRWNLGGAMGVRVIRVMRDGQVVDVELDGGAPAAVTRDFSRDVTAALQELVGVGHAIPFAGWSVFETDAEHYAAMFSLRFADDKKLPAVPAP